MNLVFRNLVKSDFNKNYFELLQQLTDVEKEKITFDMFSQFIDNLNENHIIIVFEKDGKLLASGTLLVENKVIHGLSKVGHIEDIVVDKSARGLGLGKIMIDYLVNIAKENCYKVILNCKESNIGFYEKCEFEKKEVEMVKYL